MITKASDVILKVRPVTSGVEHRYYYEGPCRFGTGEALEPGYDRLANAQKAEKFLTNLRACAPKNVEILEPVHLGRTDDWENPEEQWERVAQAMPGSDVLVIMPALGTDDLVLELVERFDKPALYSPDAITGVSNAACLRCRPMKEHLVYANLTWQQLGFRLGIFRAWKVIRTTNILLACRFGGETSYSSVDTFNNYDAITARFGVHFRQLNVHELLDQMSPAQPGGNHTTPGRDTPDLTEADMKEVEALADELTAGAEETEVSREYLINSLIAYVTVKKNLELRDCRGFTVPCPDVCSTRRINEMKFTFCLTHSLLMEQGIPSACEFDVSCVLSQQALIAVSGMSPYMGNGYPLVMMDNGKLNVRHANEKDEATLMVDPTNLYTIQHSVAHRRMRDPSKNEPFALRHFAHDQQFGAVLRYDWNRDAGQVVTLCRFSPDGKKLFIAKGDIVGGGGYEKHNCSGPVFIRVRDQEDFFNKQCEVGMHLPLVYGDYTRELIALAELFGVEAVVAK